MRQEKHKLPEKPNHSKGYRVMLGYRTFWLGHDRDAAVVKLAALSAKWEQLKATGQGWTADAIHAALAFSRAEEKQPKPTTITNNTTLFGAFTLYLADLARRVEAREVRDDYHHDQSYRLEVARRFLHDLPLVSIDITELEAIRRTFTSRPKTKRGKQMSVQYATDLFGAVAASLAYCATHGYWAAPEGYRVVLTITPEQKRALFSPEEWKQKCQPAPCFTVAELTKLAGICTPLQWRYLLTGLLLGWTQKEMASAQQGDLIVEDGDAYIHRFRSKTLVEGRWWVCPELHRTLTNAIDASASKTLLFTSAEGNPLVYRNANNTKIDSVKDVWEQVQAKARNAGIRPLPFSALRKTGAQLIKALSSHELSRVFLAHRRGDVASRHYVSDLAEVGIGTSAFQQLHQVQRKLHEALAPMFQARLSRDEKIAA